MKKYYFVNFFIIVDSKKFTHMSILSTDEKFFPVLKAKMKIKELFDKEIGENTNVIINNFQEVFKESFDEFHSGKIPDFAQL